MRHENQVVLVLSNLTSSHFKMEEENVSAKILHKRHYTTSFKNCCSFQGDSGGPLIRVPESRNATLFGILSTTSVNCSLYFQGDWDSIGTSTDVRPHLNWICDITGVCPSQASTAYPSPVSGDEVLAMKQRRMGWEDWFQGMGGVFIPTNDMSN
ncbi:hypothetical protein Y032_0103g3583 [Ancylostoma ceylanicum]|uniref:Peptidase S1 domain-containing protein n=1 Tax=Ancylostoma ceylanicum TaxID=53326 RepID=A0A016TH62_9BILA|nr:hypothetical protein Y032_0103g3583 [Ancylostoma ceylanicum]